MFIVVSNPFPLINERTFINQMFDEGLAILHLRKPDYTLAETVQLLEEIDPKHYSKIALHQYHELADRFPLQRFHFTEEMRGKTDHDLLKQKKNLKTLSTSIHKVADYENLDPCFDYCFFGPVFDSISKPGYQSTLTPDFRLPENKEIKIIAIGGVDETKIGLIRNYGFSGMALLGTIWQSKNPVDQFKRTNEKWLKKETVY